jgi:hypothetical protein
MPVAPRQREVVIHLNGQCDPIEGIDGTRITSSRVTDHLLDVVQKRTLPDLPPIWGE